MSKKFRAHTVGILAFSQIIIVFALIFLFLQLNGKKSATPLVRETSSTDSTYFADLQNFINDRTLAFEGLSAKSLGEKADHQHLLELSLEKNSVVNIWRNDTPVIVENISKNGTQNFTVPLEYGDNSLKVLVINQAQKIMLKQHYSVMYRNPMVELFRKSILRGNIDQKRLAITFDAGSDNSNTREILKILETHQLNCTLFLTGKFMEGNPELVMEMVDAGHEIANHTYSHPHLTTFEQNFKHQLLPEINREFLHQQLLKADSVFYSISGQHLKPYWRAPFGEYNNQILTWAAETGYLHIHWTGSFDTHDWVTDESSQLYRSPEEIYDDIMAIEDQHPAGLNGVIMLMHLASNRDENHVYEILPKLIESVRQRGYALGKITDLLN
jgi:peptidoglycan/xylan/chitin deacetylase (PgdA/CDA1 family)